MMILKMLGKMLAVIGIIVLSGLCLGVKAIENIGAHIAGIALVALGILAILAVVSTNWFALAVFGVLAICVVGALFGAVTLEVLLTDCKDALKCRM